MVINTMSLFLSLSDSVTIHATNQRKTATMLGLALVMLAGCVQSTVIKPAASPRQIADNRLALAIAYMERNQPQKALKNLQRAKHVAPYYLPTLLAFAHYYNTVQDTRQASGIYQQALQRYPNNSQLLHNFGIFLCQQGKYNQANNYFSKAIKQQKYTHVALTYESAAQCLWLANQTDKAIESMRAAVNHAPSNPRMIERLLAMYANNQQAHKAYRLLQQYGELLSPIRQDQWRAQLEKQSKQERENEPVANTHASIGHSLP